MGLIHNHILGRVEGSTPGDDLRALGFDPDELFKEILANENMTINMLEAMGDPIPQILFAKYAMTWLSIGACLHKEKRDRSDNFPTTAD